MLNKLMLHVIDNGGLHLQYRHRSKIYLVSFKSDNIF